MSTNIKVVNVNKIGEISERQIRRIEKAFEDFGDSTPRLTIPQREHLGSKFAPGISCDHKWQPVTEEKGLEFLKKKYEETEFDEAHFCTICGATKLVEEGKLFAFDATFKFSDKPRAKPEKRAHK